MPSLLDFYPLSRRSFLGGIAASAALVTLHPFAARANGNQAHLRLMETTDIHVNVMPYDYYADKPNDTMGLARTARLIDSIRAEAGNSMLIDNGDFLQGNPMGDYMAYQKGMKAGDVHPVIKAMNVLGYDCGTLGNHEFNYGLNFMFNTLAGVRSVWAIVLPFYLFMIAHGVHQPCGQSGAVGPFPQAAGAASALSGFLITVVAFAMGGWLGQNMQMGAGGSVLPLTNGIWFWAAAIALAAWTLVWRFGEPQTPPQRVAEAAAP